MYSHEGSSRPEIQVLTEAAVGFADSAHTSYEQPHSYAAEQYQVPTQRPERHFQPTNVEQLESAILDYIRSTGRRINELREEARAQEDRAA